MRCISPCFWQCSSAASSFHFRHCLHQVVRVVAFQVVEHDRNGNSFGVYAQFFVARVVCGASESACDVAMIFHSISKILESSGSAQKRHSSWFFQIHLSMPSFGFLCALGPIKSILFKHPLWLCPQYLPVSKSHTGFELKTSCFTRSLSQKKHFFCCGVIISVNWCHLDWHWCFQAFA